MDRIQKLNQLPYLNYIMLAIMVVVYLLMCMNGGSNNPYTLIQFGAKYNPLIIDGQYWRLFTPVFLHLSFTHILFNGITIYYIGNQIEMLFGHWRYLLLFIASSLGGNLASFAFNDNLSAGASTAIFGLFGAFLMVGESFWENSTIKNMTKTFLLFILLNLGTDLFTTGIDIQGHIGGLVAGFLTAYVIGLPNVANKLDKRVLALLTLVILAGGLIHVGFQ